MEIYLHMERIFTLMDINTVASELVEQLAGVKIVAFHGAMGSGKTTLIHAICEHMGVTENISSPTFSIIHEYQGSDTIIYHLDLYRLNGEQEAIDAGVIECLYNDGVSFIEWPEKIAALLPSGVLHVYIEPIGEHSRKLIYKLDAGKSL
jgi:tRNA threonylcarbamoyladenosine biosynthesis protein TsaE